MPHLGKIRKGWQNEHLAKFILSKFSFIAEPSTVSDDLGADIFCTSFIIKDDRLFPKNSFSIQIKTKSKKINNSIKINNKTDYLLNLGMPFFIGVVDQKKLVMSIYSGEAIPHFYTLYGDPLSVNPKAKIFINLVPKINNDEYFCVKKGNKYYLKFYWIVDIPVNYDYEKQGSELDEFFKICNILQDNISSKRNNEFLYSRYGNENICYIYAGSGSAQVYMNNFHKRFAEALENLRWLYSGAKINGDKAMMSAVKYEYNIFKRTYLIFKRKYKDKASLPEYLQTAYKNADALIEDGGKNPIN